MGKEEGDNDQRILNLDAYQIRSFTSLFRRKLKKLINNTQLKEDVQKTLSHLSADPLSQSLSTHKATSRRGKRVYSSAGTGDLRILWQFHPKEADTAELLDIGGHSGTKELCRCS